MRATIDIDDELLSEAQIVRLALKLCRQCEMASAFGKYKWKGKLAVSRRGRGVV